MTIIGFDTHDFYNIYIIVNVNATHAYIRHVDLFDIT